MSATLFFPLGAILISVISIYEPGLLAPFKSAIVPLLGVVMLGMGMSLRPENFIEVCRRPRMIVVGVGLQYLLMPFIAYLVSHLFALSQPLLLGMILVGSCPGGTASNVICYLARGDVALSISLTTVSTLLAVFLTPLLVWLYVGETVPVPVFEMMLNIFKIIVLPVTFGVLCNYYFGSSIHLIKRIFPMLSVISIILIIGIIVALNQGNLALLALPVVAAIFWHNLLGLAGGYYCAKMMGLGERQRRAIAIEVGMQNSGLAVALAQSYFGSLAALPGALFSIWHNISGSLIASTWNRRDNKKNNRARL